MNSELAKFVLQINEKIQMKAAASTLLDGDALEEGHEPQGEALTSDENSDGEDGFDASSFNFSERGDGYSKSTFVAQSYQSTNPLEIKERVSDWDSQAAKALSAIGSYFSPDNVREREERRANTAFNLLRFQSTLSELREARMQHREAHMSNWRLSNDLDSVTRRADRMDFQKAILTEKVEEFKAEV